MNKSRTDEPSLWRWVFTAGMSAGVAGILCCVAPAVLFIFGLMGGIYAISFADFFYQEDGSAGFGAWILRGLAVLIGAGGVLLYRRKQNQCSINSKRKRVNLFLATAMVAVLGVSTFFTLEKLSSWLFDEYIVPVQQAEYQATQVK